MNIWRHQYELAMTQIYCSPSIRFEYRVFSRSINGIEHWQRTDIFTIRASPTAVGLHVRGSVQLQRESFIELAGRFLYCIYHPGNISNRISSNSNSTAHSFLVSNIIYNRAKVTTFITPAKVVWYLLNTQAWKQTLPPSDRTLYYTSASVWL